MKAPLTLLSLLCLCLSVSGQATDLEELRKKAEAGDAEAQSSLGFCYQHGQGVPRDKAEAVKWYCLAAEQGFAKAQHSLGGCYAYGFGVEKDNAEAAKWYRLAAEQGMSRRSST